MCRNPVSTVGAGEVASMKKEGEASWANNAEDSHTRAARELAASEIFTGISSFRIQMDILHATDHRGLQ
jgi:hypothetical protein